jgi:hypothetical protein
LIRQAHTYLAGALSGTALIAVATIAFVLLVSAQAIRDWPLGGLGFAGGDSAEVSEESAGKADPAPASRIAAGDVADSPKSDDDGPFTAAGNDASRPSPAGPAGGSPPGTDVSSPSPAPDTPVSSSPGAGSNGGGGPIQSGSGSSPGSTGNGSGGNRGGAIPLPGGSGGGPAGVPSSPSGTVAGVVDDTVAGADTATGGAVGDTGVTQVAEGVVDGAVGPESTVGQTVDKAAETVGGLLGGNR